MNQDRVHELLVSLYEEDEIQLTPFTVLFTGKKSNRVNGLYKPATHEILLHNKNFETDNQLVYTAIHEFAHHICTTIHKQQGSRSHTVLFWSTFHNLLEIACEKGIYKRELSEAVQARVDRIKEIDRQIAELRKEQGREIYALRMCCQEEGIRTEDVIDHDLRMSRTTAEKAVTIYALNAPTEYGQDMQNIIISTNNEAKKRAVIESMNSGKSIAQIKQTVKTIGKEGESKTVRLEKEKKRIERTIQALHIRLEKIIAELNGEECTEPAESQIAERRYCYERRTGTMTKRKRSRREEVQNKIRYEKAVQTRKIKRNYVNEVLQKEQIQVYKDIRFLLSCISKKAIETAAYRRITELSISGYAPAEIVAIMEGKEGVSDFKTGKATVDISGYDPDDRRPQ
jgi:hypothetical protein